MTATILSIGIPTLMVLVGILLNRNDANRIDARVTALEVSLRSEMQSLRSQFHNDVLMLLQHDKEQDTRITRLEAHS
jgi:hypothetical protein